MFELLSICSGAALGVGVAIFSRTVGRFVTIMAIVLVASTVTYESGEAARSWTYFTLDYAQTAAAFVVGFVAVAWLRRRPIAR